jgi:cation/acetate symporter
MLCEIGFTATCIIYVKFINPSGNISENWWFGISPEGIGTIGMLVNFVVAFTVFKFTADAPDEVQQLLEDIPYQQGSGQAQSH